VSVNDDRVEITARAYGRAPQAKGLITVLAKHGATGSVECIQEEGAQWRWTLIDGAVRVDNPRTLYDGDVDTHGWIAQMPAVDGTELDRVAVVPSEAAGLAQIAAWCRQEHQKRCTDQGVEPAAAILDADDEAAICAWTQQSGRVQYAIRPVS
jgi:hypothetical protein